MVEDLMVQLWSLWSERKCLTRDATAVHICAASFLTSSRHSQTMLSPQSVISQQLLANNLGGLNVFARDDNLSFCLL